MSISKTNRLLVILNIFLCLQIVAINFLHNSDGLFIVTSNDWLLRIVNTYSFIGAVCCSLLMYVGIYCIYLKKQWSFFMAGTILCIVYLNIGFYLHAENIILGWGPLIILVCCLVSLLRELFIASSSHEREIIKNLLLTITLPILFVPLILFYLYLTVIFHPYTQDQLLLAIDATLGILPSFLAGQLALQSWFQLFMPLIKLVYVGLPLLLSIVYIARYFAERDPPFDLMVEFILLSMGGLLLYNLDTGCGPSNAFKAIWPQHMPTILLHPQLIVCNGFLPRNCLPSLHTAWMICLLRHSFFTNLKIRLFTLCWVFFTLMATLILGEHYLIDLVVGFAFASFMGGLCAFRLPLKNPARLRAIIAGGVLCVTWYVIINFGLSFLRVSHYLAWFCFLGSILFNGWLELQLINACRVLQ